MIRSSNLAIRITIRASSLALDHTAADPFDLAVMREDVDTSVAAAEKRAQQPADNRDDDGTKKCAPETWNIKTWHDLPNEFQHQRVNNQNENAQSD